MAYVTTWINKIQVSDGMSVTLLLTDAAGVMPDVRLEHQFAGKAPSGITAGFLTAFAQQAKARAIQNYIKTLAENKLQALRDQFIANRMAQLQADMQAQFAQFQIQPSDIQSRITTAWTNQGVAGVLNPPTITIDGVSVNVSND